MNCGPEVCVETSLVSHRFRTKIFLRRCSYVFRNLVEEVSEPTLSLEEILSEARG
jgi:hypothetical protein